MNNRRGSFAFVVRLVESLARNGQLHDRRSDGDRVADFRTEPGNLAIDRRRDLDSRLVGHDRGQDGVLADEIANLDVPFDKLCLCHALADIGKLDDVLAHDHASMVSRIAAPRRAGPGK